MTYCASGSGPRAVQTSERPRNSPRAKVLSSLLSPLPCKSQLQHGVTHIHAPATVNTRREHIVRPLGVHAQPACRKRLDESTTPLCASPQRQGRLRRTGVAMDPGSSSLLVVRVAPVELLHGTPSRLPLACAR